MPKQCKGHHGFYIDCHCYRFLLLDKATRPNICKKECLSVLYKTFCSAFHQGKSVQNRAQFVILSDENHRLSYTIIRVVCNEIESDGHKKGCYSYSFIAF